MDLRPIARPLLSAIFVSGGVDALRHPGPKAEMSADVSTTIAEGVGLPSDPELLVQVNGAVQVGAGVLMALGRLPQLAALALACSLVPTTIAGHPFWQIDDEQQRKRQRLQFLKNLGLLGGLLATMGDPACPPAGSGDSI